jgi:hypothetical protein
MSNLGGRDLGQGGGDFFSGGGGGVPTPYQHPVAMYACMDRLSRILYYNHTEGISYVCGRAPQQFFLFERRAKVNVLRDSHKLLVTPNREFE